MAIFDDKKKRDDQGEGFTPTSVQWNSPVSAPARPAQKGPVGAATTPPADGRKVMHSPVQPGLQPPTPTKPVTAYSAGRATRDAIGAGTAKAVEVGKVFTSGLERAGRFGRGLFGAPEAPAPAAAAAAPAPAVSPIGSAQAAPAPVVQPPAPQIITPSDSASMAVAPPTRGVQPQVVPAAPSPVVGQFNGRDFTRDQVDALAESVPVASGPVSMGPNGSFAFAAPAAAPGSLQQAAGSAPQQTPLEVPRFQPPSVDTSRVAAAEQERAKLVGQLDGQIRRMAMSPAGLNSRGERQLYAQLLSERSGLTQQAGDLAGRAAGDQVNANTTAGVAGMGQQGENARALLREAGDLNRTLLTESGANTRASAALNPPQYQTDADGNVVLTRGTEFSPVTGPEGKPLQAPRTKAEGAITPQVQLDTIVKQLQAEQSSLQPDPERIAELTQQISTFMPGQQSAAAGPNEAAVAHLRSNPALAAQFDAKYGEGASTRYLSR